MTRAGGETVLRQAEWRGQAACVGADSELFFSDDADTIAAAKEICAGCPVRSDCLDFAVATRQDDGVWGGLSDVERRRLRRRRHTAA